MRRTEIELRKIGAAKIEFRHPRTGAWISTELSRKTRFGSRSLPDVQSLLDAYMQADSGFLEERRWDLRLSEQEKIGRALWKSVFGENIDFDLSSWIHFVPRPEPGAAGENFLDFVCRVPWAMMTRGCSGLTPFLALHSLDPVAITIDAAPERVMADFDIKMPPAPRLLLVLPEVMSAVPGEDTGAAAHGLALREALEPHYKAHGALSNIKTVRSFADFDRCIRLPDEESEERFDPQIIYFYGHGDTPGGRGTQFQFERNGTADWRQIDTVANTIRQMVDRTRAPPFIWFNACLGAAADQDSALRIFAKTASCVVAMRTVVWMDASRELARRALSSIIIDGFSPPVAIREVLRNFRSDWTDSGHWASTVVAAQFTDWTALGRDDRVADYNDAVGNFPRRVDRTRSLEAVSNRLQAHFVASPAGTGPKVVFWSACQEQSPRIFEERIKDLLIERFPAQKAILLKVELQAKTSPQDYGDLKTHVGDCVIRGLLGEPQVETHEVDFSRILQLIANLSPGRSGVLAMLHGPLTGSDMTVVEAYIELWRTICEGLATKRSPPRIVLAFGFEESVEEPVTFPSGHDVERLGTVPPLEIEAHLRRYWQHYSLSPQDLEKTSRDLEVKCEGQFQKLLQSLEAQAKFRNQPKLV